MFDDCSVFVDITNQLALGVTVNIVSVILHFDMVVAAEWWHQIAGGRQT